MTSESDSLVRWVATKLSETDDTVIEWKLIVGKVWNRQKQRCVATVWRNVGTTHATWHTWSQTGEGGENDVEHELTSDQSCKRAKIEAAASAIEQGFI